MKRLLLSAAAIALVAGLGAPAKAADTFYPFWPNWSFDTTTGTDMLWAGKTIGIGTYLTVATLPTCNAGRKGALAVVTDATAPTYDGALTGGGSVIVPVFCDGSSWTSH